MNDTIRREDAINVIKSMKYRLTNGSTFEFLLQRFSEIPSADKSGEWTPCEERLPEYRKTVLISTFWGVKMGFLDSTEAYGDFWEIIEDEATTALHSIYAWMPLPKPWKGADNE